MNLPHLRSGGWQAGAKGKLQLRRYKCDPRRITVKCKRNTCVRCSVRFNRGERAFYYPDVRSLYCEADHCGKAASREFSAFD